MRDEADVIRLVVGVLEELQIPYIVGGSVALGIWSASRMTHDLDLVVDIGPEQIDPFCARFPSDEFFLDIEAMKDAFRQRERASMGMYSFTDMDSGYKVDLFPLRSSDAAQQAALARRRYVELLPNLRAAVYSPDDLLVQKLRWYAMGESQRQFRDCVNLLTSDLRLPQQQISFEYVEDWAERLGPSIVEAWRLVKECAMQQAKHN